MAKEWAKKFYKSKAWKDLRKLALRRDLFTCADCYGRAQEVHHEIELTSQNISDPNISLNINLLTCLCHDCHTRRTLKLTDCDEACYFDDTGQLKNFKNKT